MALITETGLLMAVLVKNVLRLFCGVERWLNVRRVDDGSWLMLVSSAVFLGVATVVESCVHVGRLQMLVFILLLVVLQQSSTLLALTSKRTFEPESRLIDGLGSMVG